MQTYKKYSNKLPTIKPLIAYILSIPLSLLFIFTGKRTVIFSASLGKSFSGNPKALFIHILQNEKSLNPIWVSKNKEVVAKIKKEFGEDKAHYSFSLKGLIAGSKGKTFVLSNMRGDIPYWFGTKFIVQTYHGIIIKKLYYLEDKKNLSFVHRFIAKVFSRSYDLVPCTSDIMKTIFAAMWRIDPGKCVTTGLPRNDSMFVKNDKQKTIKKYYQKLPEFKKIILYAPTFRKDKPTRLLPFDDEDQKKTFIKTLEDEKYLLLLRPHPHNNHSEVPIKHERIMFCDGKIAPDAQEILTITDILITDYSSIYLDFLLLDKPLFFVPYDLEEFQKGQGTRFDYQAITPGPHLKSFKHFSDELLALKTEDKYQGERKAVQKLFYSKPDNKSCERVTKLIKKSFK